MRKINRYVARSVVGAVSMVLLVIMALLLIGAFVDEIGSVRGNYTYAEMAIYVLLTMPLRLYEIIPFGCLIGCLIGLGILANSSELVIMRAAGVSVARITWMVLKPLMFFVILGVFLGEFVTPYTEQVAESRRAIALEKRSIESRAGSMWNREGDEFMRFNAVLPKGILYGVTRYTFDDERNLLQASFSQQAIYQGGFWQEENINITHFENQSLVAADVAASADPKKSDSATTVRVEGERLDGERSVGTSSEKIQSRIWETPLTPSL
jgi:lipopolysaccharide export system permease protein